MKEYIGVKKIKAEPCSQDQYGGAKNFGDFAKLHGGKDQEGYKVIYEDGYVSWSPKDVFEKAYKELKELQPTTQTHVEWKDRVIVETITLGINISKLEDFLNKDFPQLEGVSKEEIERLNQQLLAMKYYQTILVERIENF